MSDLEQGIREALAAYKADDGNAAQAGLSLALAIAKLLPEGAALVFGDEEDEKR